MDEQEELRDMFAGLAMQAVVTAMGVGAAAMNNKDAARVATGAYNIADALLQERWDRKLKGYKNGNLK